MLMARAGSGIEVCPLDEPSAGDQILADLMRPLIALPLVAFIAGSFACNRQPPGFPAAAPAVAPDSFDVEMMTTKGTMTVRAFRAW
jgi:hypothetical protein